ncbi:restriction endonuclease [Thermoactinomyces daqus]|uniref:Restriction endonuclease n=1 Tax=Thermoactinomyces daqus TaxID=1329516 RepID=A0A7W1XDE3_9BACL|nr:type II restriction endonuclease [Thermoactinomyces daqus]MBA4544563.1 restriction endonuclease [Thermoactinomyces daqus]
MHDVNVAIETAEKFGRFFCKFLALNDVGLNPRSHQEGIYIPKKAAPLFFDEEGQKGENKDRLINIFLEEGYPPIEARAIWYGRETRREYRITRFWAYSPFDKAEQLGNLFVMVRASEDDYYVFILNREDDIETFLNTFSISLTQNNAVFGVDEDRETQLERRINSYASEFTEFPPTIQVALKSREFYRGSLNDPDKTLVKWIETEYKIFNALEKAIYREELTTPFHDVDKLITFANTVLNRRKSRAGKSLEHHIDYILKQFNIPFDHPGKTEGNKKPDFIFPSNEDYANIMFDEKKLTFLGAKTTCKDRWRQILNEANRIPVKHLLTLQQGISKNQLEEMKAEKVQLVVPRELHGNYPLENRNDLLDFKTFIQQMKEKYGVC